MNPDFRWTISQAAGMDNLETYANQHFMSPYDGIWQDDRKLFSIDSADRIFDRLSKGYQSQFLMVCLASYLLNPKKSPKEFSIWFQSKSSIKNLLDLDFSWSEISSLTWERLALPGVDLSEGWKNKVIYALVSCIPDLGEILQIPKVAQSLMDHKAQQAVHSAASLASRDFPEARYIFWPLVNFTKAQNIKGNSLGLPTYLSFLSTAQGTSLPNILATGALGLGGKILAVDGIPEKFQLANFKKFEAFIYPLLPGVTEVDSATGIPAEGVKTLEDAADFWSGKRITGIRKIIMPYPFEDDLSKHTSRFVGRQWIINDIEKWLDDPCVDNIYWLTGAPGIGKTAISSWLCDNWVQKVAAWHFCDFNREEKSDPAKFVRSIAWHLAGKIKAYAQQILLLPNIQDILDCNDANLLFERLILQPAFKVNDTPDYPLLIVIDALDEATGTDQNRISRIIGRNYSKMPKWLRFFVASREEDPVLTDLFMTTPHKLDPTVSENFNDIETYLVSSLPQITDIQLQQLILSSDGVFLSARLSVDEIYADRISLESLDQLPRGLSGFFIQQFERYFSAEITRYKNEIRPLIRLLCTVYEPLDLGTLRLALGLKNRELLFDRLECLGTLFPRQGDSDSDTLAAMHRSLKDWISVRSMSGQYYVDIESGHSELAEYGWKEYLKNPDNLSEYLYAWLPQHLADCARNDDAAELLKDFGFMMARTKAGKFYQLLTDYKKINHPSLKDEGAFFKQFGSLIQKGTSTWPAYKILLQLAFEHAEDSPLKLGAEKYLQDGKCDWAWLRAETVTKHSAEIIKFRALSDGRMMTYCSDMTFRLLDCCGNLVALIDHKIHDSIEIENISPRNSGGFISWTKKGEFYLWDESLETPTRVNLSQQPESEGDYNQNLGVIVFLDDTCLASRSSEKKSIISAHDINGEIKAELIIDRLISCLEQSEATLHCGGMRLLDDCCVLLKSYYSALIVNQELDIIHKFIVTEQYKAMVEECADEGLEFLDFMLGGIYPLEDGRFISSASQSVYIWSKNRDGIYEIEKRVQPSCSSLEALFTIERLTRPCRVSYTDKFVYLTDGTNEYISETPQADITDLSEIYLDFPKNRSIHGHAQSIIDDKISAGNNVTTNINITYSISYGMDAHLIDNNGNLIVHYIDSFFNSVSNITYGYSDKFGYNTNRLISTNNFLKLLFKSGETIFWACLTRPILQNISPTDQYYSALRNYNVYSLSRGMNDTSSPRFALQLAPNGRAVIITADGNLCVLNAYFSNQRVGLEELERCL